jgi:hypothetical protein
MIKAILPDNETNLAKCSYYKVTIVQVKIEAEKKISVFKLKGAHIPTNLSSKNSFSLTRRDARNRAH